VKKNLLKYLPAVAVFVCAGIIFTGGYFIGSRNINENTKAPAPQLTNTEQPSAESSTTEKVDFGPFWKAWSILDSNFVGASSTDINTDQEKVWGAIEGLAASYGDPYTTFFPPDDLKTFEDDIAGNFEGVGIEIDVKDGILTVVSPLKGTPADKAGMRAKDKIIKIDGKSTLGMSAQEATKLIRGPKGQTVVFTVNREGKELEIKVVRDVIDVPVIVTTNRDDGIFVIQITSFSANSADKFREALREFVNSKKDKLILDVRGNPGGYLEAAVDIASWFLPASDVVVSEDFGSKNKQAEVFKSKGYDIFTDNLKMIMLVDEGSASASEILAGALKEHGVAKLVGIKTFGKGSVQELIPLTDNSSIKVTIAHWLTPNGVSLSKNGVDPDVVVKMTDADRTAKRDPQLDKAVELLLTQK
jgi:carboxyl-terminal processing protease